MHFLVRSAPHPPASLFKRVCVYVESGACVGSVSAMCRGSVGDVWKRNVIFQAAALSISICIPCLYLPIIFLDTWWALFPRVDDDATPSSQLP